jgi:hypothetical protein
MIIYPSSVVYAINAWDCEMGVLAGLQILQ